MDRILITGAEGQLGRDAVKLLSKGREVIGIGRSRLDVTRWENVLETVGSSRADCILHLAAFTRVDEAERFPDRAYLVNSLGSRNIARAAQRIGAKLVYISTDYVFDGRHTSPYTEFDRPCPVNHYGHSKLAGEEYIQSLCMDYLIMRVSWLYGIHGNNFVRTVQHLASSGKTLRIVNDQWGTPTWTVDVVRQLEVLLQRDAFGIYHCSAHGACTWFEFAQEIVRLYGLETACQPIETSEFPTLAKRPPYSVLANRVLQLEDADVMIDWQTGLQSFVLEDLRGRRSA